MHVAQRLFADLSNQFPFSQSETILDSLKAFMCGILTTDFEVVAAFDSVFTSWMDRFLRAHASFGNQGKPNLVEIGYHYTPKRNIDGIKYLGLRSSKGRRHFFGKGIYVGNNPHAFRTYGDTGLVVLVMKGVQRFCLHDDEEESYDALDVDTFSGNKVFHKMDKSNFTRSTYFDEVVLRGDGQVVPLLRYDRELANNADLMWRLHMALQLWTDSIFRLGFAPTRLMRPIPCFDDMELEHKLGRKHDPNNRTPFLVRKGSTKFIFEYRPPPAVLVASESCSPGVFQHEMLYKYSSRKDHGDCPICLDRLQTPFVVTPRNCNHGFHQRCLITALKGMKECPMCRAPADEPTGNCPFGVMKIRLDENSHCSGFPNVGTYVLSYSIPSGMQSEMHENPGRKFQGTKRKAYVPATDEGLKLIKRLLYAFRRGLTFHVGTSLTSGISNSVCWASIPHKRNLENPDLDGPIQNSLRMPIVN